MDGRETEDLEIVTFFLVTLQKTGAGGWTEKVREGHAVSLSPAPCRKQGQV